MFLQIMMYTTPGEFETKGKHTHPQTITNTTNKAIPGPHMGETGKHTMKDGQHTIAMKSRTEWFTCLHFL